MGHKLFKQQFLAFKVKHPKPLLMDGNEKSMTASLSVIPGWAQASARGRQGAKTLDWRLGCKLCQCVVEAEFARDDDVRY